MGTATSGARGGQIPDLSQPCGTVCASCTRAGRGLSTMDLIFTFTRFLHARGERLVDSGLDHDGWKSSLPAHAGGLTESNGYRSMPGLCLPACARGRRVPDGERDPARIICASCERGGARRNNQSKAAPLRFLHARRGASVAGQLATIAVHLLFLQARGGGPKRPRQANQLPPAQPVA